MQGAIEAVTALALEFWRSGLPGPGWKDGAWGVRPVSDSDSKDLQIAVLGPTVGGGRARADTFVVARDAIRAVPLEELSGVQAARMPTRWKGALIRHAQCRLFWPGPEHPELWAKAQVALYFLQREWLRDPDTRSWAWNECVAPVLRVSKSGRDALGEGVVGFEHFGAMINNYINPLHPGGFRSYVRGLVRRTRVDRFKKKRAEFSEIQGTSRELKDREQFLAFVRQRRKRGYPGVIVKNGRLFATTETAQRLGTEWKISRLRRGAVDLIAAAMVKRGAERLSAKRQARRWLRQAGSLKGAKQLLDRWEGSREKARRGPPTQPRPRSKRS
jgi:hypothetical protein